MKGEDMVRKLSHVSCLLSLVLAVPAMGGDRVTLPGQGEVKLSVENPRDWQYAIERADKGETPGVFLVRFTAKGQKEETPPAARVEIVTEQLDVQYRWTPNNATVPIPWQETMGDLMSKSTMLAPVYAWMSQTDANRLTFAVSDAVYPTLFSGYERDRSGSKLHNAVTFFKRGGKLLKEYSALIRYDFRDRPYYETVSEACDWIASFPGQEGRRVPDAAYEPLWNSWYGYHIGFTAKDIEREAAIAKDLGIRTIMYDMGWDRQGTTNSASFAACGDWMPDPVDFPDMKGSVDKLHKMGLKAILWLGPSLMGKDAKALARFKDKCTTTGPWVCGSCYALDPRFPEVREYLTEAFVRGVRDWGIDGWKVDFIQEFHDHGADRVAKEGLNGRDYRSIADAALALQEAVAEKTRAINPDVMFEYMMCYAGPISQREATQIRAGDCPADSVWNRNQVTRLRLLCGNRTSVCADMFTWSRDESPEACALQIISTLHGVPIYGMRLTELTPDQMRVSRHWIAFAKAHAETLYRGAFRPHGPAANYPLIEMESSAERIVTVHQPGMAVTVDPRKPTYVVNGTNAAGVFAELDGPCTVEYFDVYGQASGTAAFKAATCARLAIPRSGYAKILAK